MADLQKHVRRHVCYHAEFGRSSLKDVGINTEPQNWGALELRCLGMGGVANPKILHAPLIYCLAERGHSALKGALLDKEPTKLGSAGSTAPLRDCTWLVPENKPPLHLCYCVKFGSAASNGVRIYRIEPPKLGSAEALRCPLGVRAWLTPVNKPPPISVTTSRQMIHA